MDDAHAAWLEILDTNELVKESDPLIQSIVERAFKVGFNMGKTHKEQSLIYKDEKRSYS